MIGREEQAIRNFSYSQNETIKARARTLRMPRGEVVGGKI
jgi:hypothetical protein